MLCCAKFALAGVRAQPHAPTHAKGVALGGSGADNEACVQYACSCLTICEVYMAISIGLSRLKAEGMSTLVCLSAIGTCVR